MNPRNPYPTVDLIIELAHTGRPPEIVFIQRKNPPLGWALPGGFVDYGERVEDAARREAAEETGLAVTLTALLGVYSDPARDPRQHNLSLVYLASASGTPVGGDDAARAVAAPAHQPPGPLCFDHARIVGHYLDWRDGRRTAAPVDG